jgi:hypothetical protein
MYAMTDVELRPNHPRYESAMIYPFLIDLISPLVFKSKDWRRVVPA